MKKQIFFPFPSKFTGLFGDGPDGKEILTSMLITFYKLDQAKVDELLADGATPAEVIAKINALDKGRVKTIQDARDKLKLSDSAKAAIIAENDTALKTHYGIESDLTGTALFDFIVAEKAKEAGATTEEQIKGTPTYKALENKAKLDVKKVKDDLELQITTLKATHTKEKQFTTVAEFANTELNALNPVLPGNATVAATHKNNYINELKQFEWAVDENGVVTSVMKDGKIMEDEHGNPIDAAAFVKNVASKYFEFSANNGGENADNNGRQKPPVNNPAGYPKGITKPKTFEELTAITSNDKVTAADKRVVVDTFRKENPDK